MPAAALSHITASVVAGPHVRLVNLSRGGALMEVASRFPMRSRVRLKLSQTSGEVTVAEGVVAWARVAAIVDRQINYLVAVIFDNVIPDLGGLDAAPAGALVSAPQSEAAPAPPPVATRDNLTHFPVPVSQMPESPTSPEAWSETEEQVVSLDGETADHDAADHQQGDILSALTQANDSLAAQLAAADAERATLRGDLDTERRARLALEQEHARTVTELAEQRARVAALLASLSAREQEHAGGARRAR